MQIVPFRCLQDHWLGTSLFQHPVIFDWMIGLIQTIYNDHSEDRRELVIPEVWTEWRERCTRAAICHDNQMMSMG